MVHKKAPPISLEEVLSSEYSALRPGLPLQSTNAGELFGQAHTQAKRFSALCISGGGIRSATFALGAIQGMAEQGILQQFDYMSTVSGGGYIGGWLTAWIHRANGLRNVVPSLLRNAEPAAVGEADPIQHLREYNNYLTPQLGAFSGDAWTLATTVLRNIFLNWLVLIPLLLSTLMAPRLVLSLFTYAELNGIADAFATSYTAMYGLPLIAAALFSYSMFSTLRFLPGVGGRNHTQADFVRHCLVPIVAAAMFFCAYDCLSEDQQPGLIEVIVWMIVPCCAGWILYIATCGKPIRTQMKLLAGHLTAAIGLLGMGTGAAAWVLWTYLFDHSTWPQYVTVGPPTLLLGFAVSGALFVGISSADLKDEDREWFSRAGAKLLLFCTIWLLGCATVLIIPQWALTWNAWGQGAFATVSAITAASSSLAGFRGAYTRPGQAASLPKTSLSSIILKVAPVLFTALLLVGLTMATNLLISRFSGHRTVWWQHDSLLTQVTWWENLGLASAFFSLSWLMARYVNINMFSLEGMYRNRLIRAFLGASNPKRAGISSPASLKATTFKCMTSIPR